MGYIALRFIGQRYGAVLLGVLGGLVSSTATTLVFTRRNGDRPDITNLAVVVILLANLVVLVRLALITEVISPVIFLISCRFWEVGFSGIDHFAVLVA